MATTRKRIGRGEKTRGMETKGRKKNVPEERRGCREGRERSGGRERGGEARGV